MANGTDPYRSYNFKLDIAGVTEGHFTECSGLGVRVTPIEYREGGNNQVVRHIPGPVDYAAVTLRFGLTSSRELWDWLMLAVEGNVERKNVSIIMLDSSGNNETTRWNLNDAWLFGSTRPTSAYSLIRPDGSHRPAYSALRNSGE